MLFQTEDLYPIHVAAKNADTLMIRALCAEGDRNPMQRKTKLKARSNLRCSTWDKMVACIFQSLELQLEGGINCVSEDDHEDHSLAENSDMTSETAPGANPQQKTNLGRTAMDVATYANFRGSHREVGQRCQIIPTNC